MRVLEPHRGDFNASETLLPEDEQKEILRLREFLERDVRPVADEYWAEAEFPRHLIAPLRDLDIVGGAYEGFRDPPFSRLFSGFTSIEAFALTELHHGSDIAGGPAAQGMMTSLPRVCPVRPWRWASAVSSRG